MIDRGIYADLHKWKKRGNRKPLIIRGARQVGKSTLIKEFSKSFSQSIHLNLEKAKDRALFQEDHDLEVILTQILFRNQIPIDHQDTLIFIDEIQESPYALKLLRYFYEEYPHLFVIAAGSLLEFALDKVKSFPVGRVEYLMLHPINFEEFVKARHPSAYQKLIEVPLDPIAYPVLMDLFHEYALIGGMPEVVSEYLETGDLTTASRLYASIQKTYEDDVPRYGRSRNEQEILRFLLEVSPNLADSRITFHHFGESSYSSREAGEGLRLLEKAGFLYLLYPATATEIPVIPNLRRAPRLQYLDTGLMISKSGIQSEMIGVKDLSSVFRGRLIQHLVTQQVISRNILPNQKPLFWVREKKTSQAEVDLLIQHGADLIPVEVKSGPSGKLRSLHQFINITQQPAAIRLLGNQMSMEQVKTPAGQPYTLVNLPFFLGSRLQEYAAWIMDEYLPHS